MEFMKNITKNIIAKAIESIPEDPSIDAYLFIGSKVYEIENFETEFQQGEDYKGQPQHEVKGGLLSITLKRTSDELINSWMFKPEVAYNGTITFAPFSRMASPPITIIFEEGRCISFEKMISNSTGIHLNLLISAKKLNVNGIEHSNSNSY